MADKSLDPALRKLHIDHNKSSSFRKSMASEALQADDFSRLVTPGTEPITASKAREQCRDMKENLPVKEEELRAKEVELKEEVKAVKADNAFLRGLIEQDMKVKSVNLTTNDSLQSENKTKCPKYCHLQHYG